MVDLLDFKRYLKPNEMRIVKSSLASSNSCSSSSSLNTRQEEKQQTDDELLRNYNLSNIKQNYLKHRQADHFKHRRNLKISQVFPHFSELKPSSTITQSIWSSIEDDLNSTVLFKSNLKHSLPRKEKKQNLSDWNSDEISSSTSFIENIDCFNANVYNCSTPCEYIKSNEIEQSYKILKTHLEKMDSKLDNEQMGIKSGSYENEKLSSLLTNSICEAQDFAQKQSNKANSFSSSSQSSWASSSLTFSSMSSLDEKNYLNINNSQVEIEKHEAHQGEYLLNKTESLRQIANELDKERTNLCKNDELIKQRYQLLKSRVRTNRTSNETHLKNNQEIEQKKTSNISLVEYSYYPVHITIKINSNQNRTSTVKMPRSNSINRNKKLKFIYGQQSLDNDFYLDDNMPYGSSNRKNANLYDSQRSTSSQNRVKFSDIIQMFDPNSLKKQNDQSNVSISNMSTEKKDKPVIVFDDLKPSSKIDPILEDFEEREVEQEKPNVSNYVINSNYLQVEDLSEQIKSINQTLNISNSKQATEQKSVQTQTELLTNTIKSHDLDEKRSFYYETSVETHEDRQIFKFIPPNQNETQIKPILLSQTNVITRKEKFEPVRRKVVEIKSLSTPLVAAKVRQSFVLDSKDQVAPEEPKITVQEVQKETQKIDVNRDDSINRSSNEIQIDIQLPPRSASIQTTSSRAEKEDRENVLTTNGDGSFNKETNANNATEEKVFKSDLQWTRRSSRIGENQYDTELNSIFKRLYNRHRDSVTSLTQSSPTSFESKSTTSKTGISDNNPPRYSRIGSISKQYY